MAEFRWWRRKYVVAEGYIRPLPWGKPEPYLVFTDGFRSPKDNNRLPLYQALLNLEWDDLRGIEEFATEWGLLGLFQHRLVQARYLSDGEGRVLTLPASSAQALAAVRPTAPFAYLPEPQEHERHFAGEVLTWHGTSGPWVTVPLEDYYRQYFPGGPPSLPGGVRFPALHSAELWDHLCEPLERFQAELSQFRRVHQAIHDVKAGDPHSSQLSVLFDLDLELQRVGHGLTLDPTDGVVDEIRFPSLISAAYRMLTWEMRDRRFLFCKQCRKPFTTTRSDQLHCSPGCANAWKHRPKGRDA